MIKKIKNNSLTVFLVGILLVGLSLLLYPTISDYWNSFHQSEAVTGYVQDVDDMSDEKKADMLVAAQVYNQTSRRGGTPDLKLSDSEGKVYNQTLDVTGTGIMAYVEIPKLKTILPIYHGTNDSTLQVAIGYTPGISLSVGGKGTHTVISDHRGLPSAKLFINIDRLIKGDIFIIQVLDETLTYEADQISMVTPDDMAALAIDPEQDYVTLVTCTSYRVNSHRPLVRGYRIANKKGVTRIAPEATRVNPLTVAFITTIILLTVIGIYRRLQHR